MKEIKAHSRRSEGCCTKVEPGSPSSTYHASWFPCEGRKTSPLDQEDLCLPLFHPGCNQPQQCAKDVPLSLGLKIEGKKARQ